MRKQVTNDEYRILFFTTEAIEEDTQSGQSSSLRSPGITLLFFCG